MAVVIRLQGLSITAGSEDIRSFFTGLKIPDGGVHIIGGELEEAFIIFASDEDARRAMTRSGGCIKGSPVNLLLSSKSEMQTVLEASAKRTELNKRLIKEGFRRPVMQAGGSPAFTENLSVEIRRMERYAMSSSAGPVSPSETYDRQARVVVPDGNDGLYMHLQGMPFSASKDDVRAFFRGLQVDDILLLKNHRGQNNGRGIVKFSTLRDASEGLRRDREYIGSRFVEVNPCTEQQWIEAGGQISPRVDGSGELARELCPAYGRKRLVQDRTRSRSPLAYRSKSPSPLVEEYYALVENLSYSVETRDIKGLFHPLALQDDQILHLHDRNRRRTRACFVLFRSLKDYCNGLSRNKRLLANRVTSITPLTKDKMMEMLESLGQKAGGFGGRSSRSVEKSQPRQPTYDSERICLYVRNLPFDVRKVEIKDFFQSFGVSENTVHLLYDEKGVGLGEALVTFRSEEETLRAESLNGQRFLGSEVMLKCISRVQMREFGVVNYQRRSPEASPRESSPERYAARLGEPSLFPLNGEHPDLQVPTDAHISLREVPVGLREDDLEPGSPVAGADGPGLRRLALPGQQFDGPTCLKLLNLPLKITIDEIYNFCYGYRVIPGSVSLQYNKNGVPKGSATVVFESRQEALTAVKELSGRPIGTRKVKVVFV